MRDRVVLVAVGDDGQHRAEDLLARDPSSRCRRRSNSVGRTYQPRSRPSGISVPPTTRRAPSRLAGLDVVAHPVLLALRDQRARPAWRGRSGSPTTSDGHLGGECVDELVGAIGGHQDAGQRVADLAAVGQARRPDAGRDGGRVGVVEDDRRGLAAEFEADPLEVGARTPRRRAVPAAVEPVNDTLSTPGWFTRCSPTVAVPGQHADHARRQARSRRSSRPAAGRSSGDSGAGLSTTVQPASSAGISLVTIRNCGMFHGTIAATTPTGSRRMWMSEPKRPGRVSCHG